MQSLYEEYLDAKRLAWSESTLKSERRRLSRYFYVLEEGPAALWDATKTLAPYSRKTLFIRVSAFYDWAVTTNQLTENPYKQWMAEHARLFKYVYNQKTPTLSFREAEEAVLTIPCKASCLKALQLLGGGLRWNESFNIDDGSCTGKGGKVRKVFADPISYPFSYTHFRKHLAAVGMKPHDLRKIRATDLARSGLREVDLCKVFGWSNLNTAKAYIAPINDQKLKELMNEKHS